MIADNYRKSSKRYLFDISNVIVSNNVDNIVIVFASNIVQYCLILKNKLIKKYFLIE